MKLHWLVVQEAEMEGQQPEIRSTMRQKALSRRKRISR